MQRGDLDKFKVLVIPDAIALADETVKAIRTAVENGIGLVTTHDLEKIMAHADRLILMQSGKIARDGVPHDIVGELEAFGVRKPCAFRAGQGLGSWLN